MGVGRLWAEEGAVGVSCLHNPLQPARDRDTLSCVCPGGSEECTALRGRASAPPSVARWPKSESGAQCRHIACVPSVRKPQYHTAAACHTHWDPGLGSRSRSAPVWLCHTGQVSSVVCLPVLVFSSVAWEQKFCPPPATPHTHPLNPLYQTCDLESFQCPNWVKSFKYHLRILR